MKGVWGIIYLQILIFGFQTVYGGYRGCTDIKNFIDFLILFQATRQSFLGRLLRDTLSCFAATFTSCTLRRLLFQAFGFAITFSGSSAQFLSALRLIIRLLAELFLIGDFYGNYSVFVNRGYFIMLPADLIRLAAFFSWSVLLPASRLIFKPLANCFLLVGDFFRRLIPGCCLFFWLGVAATYFGLWLLFLAWHGGDFSGFAITFSGFSSNFSCSEATFSDFGAKT